VNRERALETLRKQRFDVVVIGGGITGAGVALDAASRGLTVALVEKSDFASGTSSRSSKVIHGGLRYLKNLQFGVTIESVRERETLQRMAPHLVRPLRILLPYDRSLGYKAALSIYDLIASSPRRHQRVEPGEMQRIAPYLRTDGVRGAFQYFDAAADDCRLVMEVLKKAVELGAVIANYVAVGGFTSEGVQVTDSIANGTFAVRGSTIVNATGVWSDTVRQKLDGKSPRLLRASKGVHLVIDSAKLRLDAAVTIPKTSSGHYLFIAPWEGRTIIGTTDTEYDGSLDRPLATREDIAMLLSAVDEWFPAAHVTESDVLAVYAGLRSLAASTERTYAAPREDFIERQGRMITVAGGKLTTFRRMAKRVVDMVTSRPCVTDRLSLVSAGRAIVPVGTGRIDCPPLYEAHPHTWAEIDFIIRNEMPMTVADVLARRTRLALIANDHGRAVATRVADRLAQHLGWSAAQREAAVTQYHEEVKEYCT
jgi:glycerol-3-phosphate dehydrogenase